MIRGGQGGDERHRIIKIKIMEINRAGALGVDEHLPAARGPKEQAPSWGAPLLGPQICVQRPGRPSWLLQAQGWASLRVHAAGHEHMAGNAKDRVAECTPFPGRKLLAEPVPTREDA